MLREISIEKFLEWKVYELLEPFPAERADLNAAHIVQFLWKLSGDTGHPNGRALSEFVLPFGDRSNAQKAAVQTVAYQEKLIDSWIFISNAMLENKAKGT